MAAVLEAIGWKRDTEKDRKTEYKIEKLEFTTEYIPVKQVRQPLTTDPITPLCKLIK